MQAMGNTVGLRERSEPGREELSPCDTVLKGIRPTTGPAVGVGPHGTKES